MTTLVTGGTKLLLVAWQISLAFRCWRPTLANVKWLIVRPPVISYESSIREFSKNHVTFGVGFPVKKSKEIFKINVSMQLKT